MISGGLGAAQNRGISKPDLADWVTQSRAFTSAGTFIAGLQFTSERSQELIRGACIDSNVMPTLGAVVLYGRGFDSGDEAPNAQPTVILGYGLWQSLFAGDRGTIGSDVRLNDRLYKVIGVLPEGMFFPDTDSRLWVSSPCGIRNIDQRGTAVFHAVGRLRQSITAEQAQRAVDAINSGLRLAYPDTNKHTTAGIVPLVKLALAEYERALRYLLIAVLLVMLIACGNVVNLFLTRGLERRSEFTIRIACGAGYWTFMRQLLVEACAVALVASLIGTAAAPLWLRLLLSVNLADIPRLAGATINVRVLTATLALALFSTIVAAIWPATKIARFTHPGMMLKDYSFGYRTSRITSALASVEFVGAFVLVLGATVTTQAFFVVSRANWGFAPEHLLVVAASVPTSLRDSNRLQADWLTRVTDHLRTIHGVTSAASTNAVPTRWASWKPTLLRVRGRIVTDSWSATTWVIGPRFFNTAGIPILDGRDFVEADNAAAAPRLIISKSLAERVFGLQPAVGDHLELLEVKTVNGQPPKEFFDRYNRGENLVNAPHLLQAVEGKQWEIIGVAGDIRMFGLEQIPRPSIYINRDQLPNSQQWRSLGSTPEGLIVVRTSQSIPSTQELRTAVTAEVPASPHVDVIPMTELLARSVGGRGTSKLVLIISIVFASIAFVLATAGVFAIVTYGIGSRRQELSIRGALGAGPVAIMFVIGGYLAAILGPGLAVGAACAWLLGRLLESLFPYLHGASMVNYGVCCGALAAATVVASIPAFRLALRSASFPILKS
jgi:putative ABC transport system permease protein